MATIFRPAEARLAARVLAALVLMATLAAGIAIAVRAARPVPAPATIAATVAQPAPQPARVAAPTPPAPAPAPTPTSTPTTEAFVIKRILPIQGPIRFGEWHWDEDGVPAGPLVITVDLKAQVISVFRAGYEIGAAAAIYGADEKPTPLGVFPITEKDADHVSNLYDAPMPYMLRMTNDGISIHGSDVADNDLTHGCIGVPTSFARKLFGEARLGDKVIVTNGERLDVGKAITAA